MKPLPSDAPRNNGQAGNDNAVREEDLQAYVDGQLDARRRAGIEAYLAAHPREAARLAAYRNQNIGLHALFDPLDGPNGTDGGTAEVPPALAALARELDTELAGLQPAAAAAGQAAAPRRLHKIPRLAASIALVLAAGVAAWIALQQAGPANDPRVALTHDAAPNTLQATGQQAPLPVQPAAAQLGNDGTTTKGAGITAKGAAQEGTAVPVTETIAVPTEAAPVMPATESAPAKAPAPQPLENIDPAIERSPLIPVPAPEPDTTAKST